MRFNFLKLSILALAIGTFIVGSLGATNTSEAAQATLPATVAATSATMAATTAPTIAATARVTAAATTASGVVTAAATSAGVTAQLPPCPNTTATSVATVAVTAAATSAATTAATAVATPSATSGYLGIAAEQVQSCGARISEVRPSTPAATAKLATGDVIVAVNGKPISGLDDLRAQVWAHKKGDTLTLTYQRDGKQADVTVTLDAIPPDTTATLQATAAATASK